MKKVLIILSVLMAVAVLASGISIAYAKDNGNGIKPSKSFSNEWLMGTVVVVNVDAAGNGTITLISQGNGSNVNVVVNGDTRYRSWSAPWQDVSAKSLAYGDWVAVCLNNGVAQEVILLEVPFRLNLGGNVTAVNTYQVTVLIKGGGSFTIDLSNAGANILGNISRIQVGQPVNLTIGAQETFFERYFPGLHLGWYIGKGNQGLGTWMTNKDFQNKMENLRQNLEQRYGKWHEQGHN